MRVLIVDDQPIVRQGLKVILEQDESIKVVGEAEHGKVAIEWLEQNNLVDLILMDVRMPVMNGMEATRMIKRKWPDIKILILTTFNDEQYALETLKDGASGFLLKSADSKRLIGAVHSTMQGGMAIHDDVAAKVIPRLLNWGPTKDLPANVTEREIAIISRVGAGKTNKEISEELHLSIGTVKNHMTTILQKLHVRDRTQLAIFAVKNNITL